jgi:hypothetical protein
MISAPRRYLIAAPRLLPAVPLVVHSRYLTGEPRLIPAALRRYLIAVPGHSVAAFNVNPEPHTGAPLLVRGRAGPEFSRYVL